MAGGLTIEEKADAVAVTFAALNADVDRLGSMLFHDWDGDDEEGKRREEVSFR